MLSNNHRPWRTNAGRRGRKAKGAQHESFLPPPVTRTKGRHVVPCGKEGRTGGGETKESEARSLT